jgi:hypothetical protein
VSLRRRADGSQAVFPHFVMDRAKPGMLTVNQAGERFVGKHLLPPVRPGHAAGPCAQSGHPGLPGV